MGAFHRPAGLSAPSRGGELDQLQDLLMCGNADMIGFENKSIDPCRTHSKAVGHVMTFEIVVEVYFQTSRNRTTKGNLTGVNLFLGEFRVLFT